ncbi:MAG TPA: VWA domain-containing protein [Bryobacteraceae bacterium]|jgi:VWFA-related protein
MMRNYNPERSIVSSGMHKLLVGVPLLGLTLAALLVAQEPAKTPSVTGLIPANSGNNSSTTSDPGNGVQFKTGVRAVQAPVTVLDRQGHVVTGLNALDFQLYDNNKLQEITEDLSEHPISLVVAIQANAGMEHILPEIRKIGSLFDGLVLGDEGEIAVVAFDHRVQVLTNFTSDPDKIHAAFNGKDKNGNYVLKAGSWTSALNDAVMESVNMLRTRPVNRKRIIILISESRDQGSGLHVRDVLTAQEFANVVVYPVDVSHLLTSLTATPTPSRPNTIPPGGQYLPNGQVMTPTTDQQLNNNGDWTPMFKELFIAAKAIFVPNPLEVYSRYTGGREYPFFTQKGLEQAISDIGNDLHNQYILTFTPNDQGEAGYHTIKVVINKPELKVFTREGYWMAGKPE